MSQFELPEQPITWLFAGDSITQAVGHLDLRRGWVEIAQERIGYQLDRLTDVFINTGVSGWTTGWVRENYDWLIGRFHADVVSISLGTNDANVDPERLTTPEQARANLSELVDRARADGASTVLLHTPALITRAAYELRPGFDDFAPMIRDLAADKGSLTVDHDRRWRDRWGDEEPVAWLADPIHPNARGHVEMANTLFAALGVGDFEPEG